MLYLQIQQPEKKHTLIVVEQQRFPKLQKIYCLLNI